MTCYGSKTELVPNGFGFVGASNASVGPTPYCPPGASKWTCGTSCCNANKQSGACQACGFFVTPQLCTPATPCAQSVDPDPPGHTGRFEAIQQQLQIPECALARPGAVPWPDPASEGWTEIGIAVSTDYAPVIDYLTKSCGKCQVQPYQAQCNGCESDADTLDWLEPPGGEPFQPYDGTSVPQQFRPGGNPWLQRKQNAYESKTMWSNYGMGYGNTMAKCGCFPLDATPTSYSSLGFRFGQMHAGGCKDNRCNQDPFYHPAITVATAPLRRFRLYAKANQCGSSRWSYAVAPMDMKSPLFITLANDPRQPPFNTCSTVDFLNQSLFQIITGDRIYIPGQPGTFLVNLYVDNTVPYRANASVFRGYSPVRPLRGARFTSNSGFRNLTSHPGAGGLLRPF